ncbi:MAG: hypothetical protein ACLFVP_08435 [Candidatus Bathyarchaeia archaeon]
MKTSRYCFAPGLFEYTFGKRCAGDPAKATEEYGNRRHDVLSDGMVRLIKAMISLEEKFK